MLLQYICEHHGLPFKNVTNTLAYYSVLKVTQCLKYLLLNASVFLAAYNIYLIFAIQNTTNALA